MRKILTAAGICVCLALCSMRAYAAEIVCDGNACVIVFTEAEKPQEATTVEKPKAVAAKEQNAPETPDVQGPATVLTPRGGYVSFLQSAEQAIRAAEGPITIATDTWISFNRPVMQAIEDTGKETVVRYRYRGTVYETVIPAGYPATSLLNADGYCGFLHLQSMFGSESL